MAVARLPYWRQLWKRDLTSQCHCEGRLQSFLMSKTNSDPGFLQMTVFLAIPKKSVGRQLASGVARSKMKKVLSEEGAAPHDRPITTSPTGGLGSVLYSPGQGQSKADRQEGSTALRTIPPLGLRGQHERVHLWTFVKPIVGNSIFTSAAESWARGREERGIGQRYTGVWSKPWGWRGHKSYHLPSLGTDCTHALTKNHLCIPCFVTLEKKSSTWIILYMCSSCGVGIRNSFFYLYICCLEAKAADASLKDEVQPSLHLLFLPGPSLHLSSPWIPQVPRLLVVQMSLNDHHKPRRTRLGFIWGGRFSNLWLQKKRKKKRKRKERKAKAKILFSEGDRYWNDCGGKFHSAIRNGQNSYAESGLAASPRVLKTQLITQNINKDRWQLPLWCGEHCITDRGVKSLCRALKTNVNILCQLHFNK